MVDEDANPSGQGVFARAPLGIVLHGSRSGLPHSIAEEYHHTRRYARSGAEGKAWHVTCGEDRYSRHLPARHWGWHCREHSPRYLGLEFAQARAGQPVTEGQLRAAARWFWREVALAWPPLFERLRSRPEALLLHSELPAGRRDGMTDTFGRDDPRGTELKRRLLAALREEAR